MLDKSTMNRKCHPKYEIQNEKLQYNSTSLIPKFHYILISYVTIDDKFNIPLPFYESFEIDHNV